VSNIMASRLSGRGALQFLFQAESSLAATILRNTPCDNSYAPQRGESDTDAVP
jgi:hypothetical protein